MGTITTITDVLNSWTDFGIFAYVLPFLMIFAVVFGILNKTRILGDNRGVQATISIAIGLLSLQLDYVSSFFATIFPYTGIGIAVLLIALILTGLLSGEDDAGWVKYVWFGVGSIIFIVILVNAFSDVSWMSGKGWGISEHIPLIVFSLVFIIAFILIIVGGKDERSKKSARS